MADDRARLVADEYNRFAERMNVRGRCDPTLAFDAPERARVAALWKDKAPARGIPSRRDLNAHALKTYLPNVGIVDITGRGEDRRYRVRLMGTAITEVLGEHTGKFLDEAIPSPFRERWSAVLDVAVKAGGPMRIVGRIEYNRQDYLTMEALVAPIGTRESAEAVLIVAYVRLTNSDQATLGSSLSTSSRTRPVTAE
jgi:hypothetical protein